MKILMFCASFGSNLDTFMNNEIKYLSKSHQIKCVCNNYIKEFQISDVEEINIDRSTLLQKIYFKLYQYDLHLTFKDKKFSQQINGIIENFQPDVIHCHFAYESLMLLDNLNNFNIPIIMHFHGYGASKCLTKKSYIRKIKKYLLHQNIYPIYVSDLMKSNLEKAKIPLKKGLKLYYGINLNEFNPNNRIETTPFIFLQVSTLVEKKGIIYTLQAFSKFLKNKDQANFNLILTGDNKDELIELKEMVKKLDIEKSVTFFGRASHNQVIDLMNNANVFVHHSITAENGDQEGIPNAIMEAMAMRLPIISTYHAGIPELVENNINGFLVDEKDVNTYAEKMNEILSWKPLDNNRAVIDDQFNYEKHNSILENFYFSITNK